MTTLQRSATSDLIAEEIRARVAAGELRPGERLREVDFARALGVSRSPLREALLRLAAEGLVRSEPYRGTYVASLDGARLRELLEFRLVLEEFAVRRLGRRRDPADLERLEAALATLEAATRSTDLGARSEAVLRFHEALIELGRNRPLQTAYASLLNELRLYIRVTLKHYASPHELTGELAAFLAALRKKRVEDAVRLLRRHIEHGFENALSEIA